MMSEEQLHRLYVDSARTTMRELAYVDDLRDGTGRQEAGRLLAAAQMLSEEIERLRAEVEELRREAWMEEQDR